MFSIRWMALVAMIATIVVGNGCSEDPEQRVRKWIEDARVAAEAGSLAALRDMVAEDYADDHGNDRAAMLAMVGYYIRIEDGLHIWIRIDEIDLAEPKKARVQLLVALATGPIERPQDLARLRAEVHRITLTLVEAAARDWLLASTSWTRAGLADVL